MTEQQIITPRELAFDYEFMRLIGEGSYGKTWLAKDLHTGERVAIKSLKVADDFKSIELFKREAEVLESISVVGVPKFYKSIIPENALESPCYIIQEYIEYPSIQMALDQKQKFTEAQTLEVMKQVAGILGILQTHYQPPIIHRDIKPSNIMYQKSENGISRVFLIDFGSVSNPEKRTGGSTIAGTFGYMAPEQLLGDCTIQSDFYSLGASALHMITGVAPYLMDSDGFSLNFMAAIDKYAPETTEPMRKLLSWLLSSRTEDRPKNARILIQAISKVSQGKNFEEKAEVCRKEYAAPVQIDESRWIKTDCTVWCMNLLADSQDVLSEVFEYTFVVDGRTWNGMTLGMQTDISSSDKLPCKRQVWYDPQNPRLNRLVTKTDKNVEVPDFNTSITI